MWKFAGSSTRSGRFSSPPGAGDELPQLFEGEEFGPDDVPGLVYVEVRAETGFVRD